MTSSQLLDKSINALIEQVLFKPDRPRFDERIENINRIEPVRISRAGPLGKSKKRTSEAIPSDYIAVPTEAELDYYSMGLQLPDKAENLEKLYRDMVTTGKFDYELCYLLRKQEALSELQDWVKVVWTKRRQGDAEFGKDTDANRFNHLAESAKTCVSSGTLFRDALLRSLANEIEN